MGAVPSRTPRGRTRIELSANVWLSLLLAAVIAVAAALAGPTRLPGTRFGLHQGAGAQPMGSPGQSQSGQPQHLTGFPVVRPPAQIGLWVALAGLIIIAAGATWVLRRLWRQRRHRRDGLPTAAALQTPWWKAADVDPDPDALERGLELAVTALEAPRDPTDAVTQAWLGLEAAAEASGVRRRAAETPTEFTQRVMQRAFSDDRAVRTLLRLYLRTRFGAHPPTDADVLAVRAALAQLLTSRPRGSRVAGSVR